MALQTNLIAAVVSKEHSCILHWEPHEQDVLTTPEGNYMQLTVGGQPFFSTRLTCINVLRHVQCCSTAARGQRDVNSVAEAAVMRVVMFDETGQWTAA